MTAISKAFETKPRGCSAWQSEGSKAMDEPGTTSLLRAAGWALLEAVCVGHVLVVDVAAVAGVDPAPGVLLGPLTDGLGLRVLRELGVVTQRFLDQVWK